MTATLATLLEEFEVTGSESEFVTALRAALTAEPRANASRLTDAEHRFLTEHSGVAPLAADSATDPAAATMARARVEFDLFRRSRTAAELALAWRVDGSRVRHRVRNGLLYGFRVGRNLRLPDWQFDGELRPLPGLSSVLAALPAALHPREIEGFMTTPQDGLRTGGDMTSPREWLLAGGEPSAVAALAADLDRW
ncbi:MAG: DNA-binding protein [Actinomycetia bacterium]|nr:DNA-binding protein [Actinomycetes bacterium]